MNILTLADYLVFSAILFALGLIGIFVNRTNFILVLICLELILLAVSTNFIAFAEFAHDTTGQIVVFFILAIAAIKTAVGLAILILLYKRKHPLSLEKLNFLKG